MKPSQDLVALRDGEDKPRSGAVAGSRKPDDVPARMIRHETVSEKKAP